MSDSDGQSESEEYRTVAVPNTNPGWLPLGGDSRDD